ncbi:MAG TPA: radical SAM protein [Victivallales bacterium]|nr:radical SAM protein [Victivallales bacterium]
MINVSRLYCGVKGQGDHLRYKKHGDGLGIKKPVVVWNMTKQCNLYCAHCYADASLNKKSSDELTTEEGKKFIDSLAAFNIPVLLFSGGEPFVRKDIFELIEYTKSSGIRPTISTNGTLIDKTCAEKLKQLGITYVGISLDGRPETHNKLRGIKNSFEKAMEGIRNCTDAGVRVGLRYTMHRNNYMDVPYILDLMEAEEIPRICFYHLVCSGRGKSIKDEELSVKNKRYLINLIMDKAKYFSDKGLKKEILTVANYCDAPFLYLRMLNEDKQKAEEAMSLIKINKGGSSGLGIGAVNWNGDVYPDQFWRDKKLGNIRENSFEEIWINPDNDLLNKLRSRTKYIKGRCSKCRFINICEGNFRARAEAITGDMWESDPGCYLTDEEISNVE